MQKILSGIIFIGFGIQIVLGILWMCNAFAELSGPGEGIVCVGAMLLLGIAVWFLKSGIRKSVKLWTDIFIVLAVLTFPFVLQSIVNPDRRILITSALLLGAGGVLRLMRPIKGVRLLAAVLGFWLLAGAMVVGVESIGRGMPSVSTRLTERIVWTTLYNSYSRLPEESRKAISYRKLTDSTYEVNGIEDVLIPSLTEKLGEQETARIMGELRSVAWQYEKKQILKEIIWDATGYAISPVVVPMQLSGRAYESYTGMNYRELLQPSPKLGKLYTNYSCWWFAVALGCSLLLGIGRLIKDRKSFRLQKYIVVGVPALAMVMGYTLNGAGRMDYKNTLYVLCIWLVWMAASIEQTGGNQDEKE